MIVLKLGKTIYQESGIAISASLFYHVQGRLTSQKM